MSEMTSAQRSVRAVIREEIEPYIDAKGIPNCSDACPQYDGKWCRLLGARPRHICDPAMDDMAKVIEGAAKTLGLAP